MPTKHHPYTTAHHAHHTALSLVYPNAPVPHPEELDTRQSQPTHCTRVAGLNPTPYLSPPQEHSYSVLSHPIQHLLRWCHRCDTCPMTYHSRRELVLKLDHNLPMPHAGSLRESSIATIPCTKLAKTSLSYRGGYARVWSILCLTLPVDDYITRK